MGSDTTYTTVIVLNVTTEQNFFRFERKVELPFIPTRGWEYLENDVLLRTGKVYWSISQNCFEVHLVPHKIQRDKESSFLKKMSELGWMLISSGRGFF